MNPHSLVSGEIRSSDTGFAKSDPSEIRTDGTRVTDEAPDCFHSAFRYALNNGEVTAHRTIDSRLTIGVYPLEACPGTDWHCLPCEPLEFKGDAVNVFKVIISVNPFKQDYPGVPYGGGVAVVLPLYRSQMESFISAWLAEIREAPRTRKFEQYNHNGHLLRWIPEE